LKPHLLSYKVVSDRLMYVRIKAKPFNLSFFQAYAPTMAATEEEADDFYTRLREEIVSAPSQDMLLMAGDFNAKIGQDTRSTGVGGKYGLGELNGNGERLLNFCQENDMVITNTLFSHHKRRRYTWCSPDGVTRNQIDYILVKRRFQKCVLNSRAYPGPDCGSDHNMVGANVRLRIRRDSKPVLREVYDLTKLEDDMID